MEGAQGARRPQELCVMGQGASERQGKEQMTPGRRAVVSPRAVSASGSRSRNDLIQQDCSRGDRRRRSRDIKCFGIGGEPGGNRTRSPQIKSPFAHSKTKEIRMISRAGMQNAAY